LLTVGLGTLLAALNVAYRAFRYVIPFLVQFGMFATPSIYLDLPPDGPGWRSLLWLNPLTGLIAAFRATALGGPILVWEFAYSGFAAVLLFLAGCLYFRKVEDTFADTI
jgi:lipopolysaccharide transport system permease protein